MKSQMHPNSISENVGIAIFSKIGTSFLVRSFLYLPGTINVQYLVEYDTDETLYVIILKTLLVQFGCTWDFIYNNIAITIVSPVTYITIPRITSGKVKVITSNVLLL
jgi:hypothetical protein